MNSKFVNVKYLAVLLLAAVFLLLISYDAFSQSEIDLGSVGDTATLHAFKDMSDGYSVSAKIDIIKTLRSANYDLDGCLFGVELTDGGEKYYANCLSAIIRMNIVERVEVLNGKNKERFINLDIDFANIDGLNALKYGLKDLQYREGILSFVTADLAAAGNFLLNLKVVKKNFLKDKIILDRNLNPADYSLESLGNGLAKISVVLAQIGGGIDADKKYTVKLGLKALKIVDVKGAINTQGLTNSLEQTLVIGD